MECCSLYKWHVSLNGGSCYGIHQETTASWRHLGQVATGSTGTCRELPGSKTVSTFLAREPVVVKLETNGRACPTPATASTASRRSITSTKDSVSSSGRTLGSPASSHEPPKWPQCESWNHPALASTRRRKSRNGIHLLSRCNRVSSGSSAIDSNEMTVTAVKTARGGRSWRSQHPWPHQRAAHAVCSVSAQSSISETPLGYTARTSCRRQHDVSRRALAMSAVYSRCLGGSCLSHSTPRIMTLPGEDILKGALRREGRTKDGCANPIGFPVFLLGNSRRLAGHLCRGTDKRTRKVRAGEEVVDTEDVDRLREAEGEEQRVDDAAGKQAKRSSDGGKLSGQSSWDTRNAQGEDYLYRLGKEADNLNITVGARAGVIDDLFVGGFLGKDADIVFKYRQQVTRKFEHIQGDYYIAPKFMYVLCVVHIGKNYLADQIDARVPLILGIWGGKGQGKTFQTELIFKAIGIEPVILSAGELESERAGEPGRLIRDRYRAASAVVKTKGVMSCLMINDLDAGVGRAPTREDLIEIVHQMYKKDNLSKEDVGKLIDLFPGQALDFYGALHSRTYDDQIKKWVEEIGGPENVVRNLMKRGEPRPTVTVPQKLDDFLKLVEDRWHDPQEAQKATDEILTLHTRQFKSVREATDAVDRLICVLGVRYDPQVLLTSYLRCFPMYLRNQLAGEANINMHNFPSFSKKALYLEAKIGHGHNPTTDGRKKTLPPNWKAKGRIMFVDNDGSTIELDNEFQAGVGSEAGSVDGRSSRCRSTERYGLYEFVVMPFGLRNAPGTFQHAMNRIFHDYLDKFVLVYLDGILIFSKTVEEHVAHLDKVLSLLRQHKFKINSEKCEFGRTRVLYLGHEISAEGLKPDDAKVANIRDWPRPQSVNEMRSFLGMTGYYRNFVKNYSIVAAPLIHLTRLDTPWEWTDRCEAAFRQLKHALTHHEVLKLPDPDKPFVVTMNAIQYGIGPVLAQQEGKKLRLVEYMSKKMPSQKLAKSTYEKELYAIYKAFTHWRHYLLGRFFYVRTDHQTLKWMRTQPVLSDALKRWIEVIEQYDFEPQYIKGEYNKVADALSRRPDFSGALITEFGLADDVTHSMVEAYREDQFMSEIIRRFEAKDKITSAEFELVNGLLFNKYARLVAMPETAKTEYVIRLFKENWVRDFELPKSIVSDRDGRFTSELWKAAAAEQGTQLQMTSGNHPEANGQAEQLNRAVQHLLRYYIKPNQVDWEEKLALIASPYNNAVHSATGVSLNSLLLTFKPRLPLDFLLPDNQSTAAPGTLEFAYRYEQLMQQAVEQMHKTQAAMIETENKHRRPSTFQIGDRVWVKSSELGQEHWISHKLMPQYFGPWEVLDVVGEEPDGPSYVIRIPGHLHTYPIFHASKLAPFKETEQFPSRCSMLPPTMDGEVDIDDIVDHREMPVSRPTGRGRPPKPKLQYRVSLKALIQAGNELVAEQQKVAEMKLSDEYMKKQTDADAQARRKEAQALLQRHEANSIEKLKYWHFEPNGDEPTPEEHHKEFMAKLVSRLVYTCNHLQSELANLQRVVRNHKIQHEDATRALDARVLGLEQAVPGPDAGASSSASSSRQLEEHVDQVVAMLGDISVFTEPATISQRFELLDTKISQQQQTDHSHNNSSARPYKMPTFRIEKFDDYTHQDPVVWWQGFTTELGIHEVPDHLFISALFINTKGGCQIWLSHMATIHGVQVSDLYKKVSWEDMTKEWKKRFIVDDAQALAVKRIFTMAQGSTPTCDWLTDWQKIVATPDLDLSFSHLRREFYNRSCAALSLALGDCEQYSTFAEIINKARELIKTNRPAAHEKSTWQPTYVEKVRTGPRQQQFAAVQSDSGDNPAATPASSDGDQVASVQPRSTNKSRNNGKAKSASRAGNGQP
ncbi:hypothetical protein CBR_g38065 [Chara braunii]|uniref:Integrase catalytic domain-containing protein n=1 Tax=Chara braunii TaxID=69332 RepID=A0A388K096_CHABU|nr:hypothetical protein CBR_g38065 [Chara braunii]|eukprot:GBG63445.1 hypothetical protein CBR_g38065 [Chara braunii]